jgi:hypothetical protein
MEKDIPVNSRPWRVRQCHRPRIGYFANRQQPIPHGIHLDDLPQHVAGLAQLVVHLICNQGVGGSSPSAGTIPAFADLRRRTKR